MAITHDTTIYACDWSGCIKQMNMPMPHRFPEGWMYMTITNDLDGDAEVVLCPDHAAQFTNNLDTQVWD